MLILFTASRVKTSLFIQYKDSLVDVGSTSRSPVKLGDKAKWGEWGKSL